MLRNTGQVGVYLICRELEIDTVPGKGKVTRTICQIAGWENEWMDRKKARSPLGDFCNCSIEKSAFCEE